MNGSSGGGPPTRPAGPDALFWDQTLLLLPTRTRMTALGLWHQHVDSTGAGPADPKMVHEAIWLLHPDVSVDDVLTDLVLLGDAAWLDLLDGPTGDPFLQLRGWPSTAPPAQPTPGAAAPPTPALAASFRVPESEIGHSAHGVVKEGREEGRKGGGGEEGAGAPPPRPAGPVPMAATLALLVTLPEPSPWCWRHQPWGTEEKCGPCGGARKRHEMWVKAQTAHANPA